MKIPLSLIKSFLSNDLSAEQIGDTLTLLGLEVDAVVKTLGGDFIFDISLTPNLGHCMSALGIARELSAHLRTQLTLPKNSIQKYGKPSDFQVKIREKELCPRYVCQSIENVSIQPSPAWLQDILVASGMQPVCNVVDAANYIMLKRGQPFHIFDADAIAGKSLVIEKLIKTTPFVGLDNQPREVLANTLVVADAQGVLAIAGILGAQRGSVGDHTKNILVEAALFDSASIRQTTKSLAFRSESSQRFEKGVDPNGSLNAVQELISFIQELSGGLAERALIDTRSEAIEPCKVRLRMTQVHRMLGLKISATEIADIFHWLQMPLKEEREGVWIVSVPPFRADISEEIDLVEEVARIYGYNHIEKPTPRFNSSQIPNAREYSFEKNLRQRLVGFGLQEFLTADLISPKMAAAAFEWIRPGASLLTVLHAKTEEYSILRPSLLPGMMQSAKENFNQKTQTLHAFEVGRIHFLQNDRVIEEPMAAILLTGEASLPHWSRKTSDVDFFDLKGLLENLFEAMHVPHPRCEPSGHPSFHPSRQANLFVQERCLGSFGEVHPTLLEKCHIKQRLFYAEINLHLLMDLERSIHAMRPLAQFPNSERDATLSLPLEMPIARVFEKIASTASLLLEKAKLIDLYIPGESPTKNATFRFSYRDPLKTISLEEVESAHAKLLNSLLNELPLE